MTNKLLQGDALKVLKTLPAESVDCIVTSPPYWGLRDYGIRGQLGSESTPEEYVQTLVRVFEEGRRVLKNTGTFWLNIGDSYASNRKGGSQGKNGQRANRRLTASTMPKCGYGLKDKDLVGIPWMVAFALRASGWYLRQDIIWSKPNPMPESVLDRCTKSHEYVFLLSKSKVYHFDHSAIAEPLAAATVARGAQGTWRSKGGKLADGVIGMTPASFDKAVENMLKKGTRNKRSVWTINTKAFNGAHFATFPEALIEPMVLAGCPKGGWSSTLLWVRGPRLLLRRDLDATG